MERSKDSERGIEYIFFTLVLIFLSIISFYFYDTRGLIKEHIAEAELFDQGKSFPAHTGFYLFSVFVQHLLDIPIEASCKIVACLHVLFTFAALYHVLSLLSARFKPHFSVMILLALSLMVVAPIGLPYIPPEIYLGQHSRATAQWMNSTHTTVQPYIILAFGYCSLLIEEYVNTSILSTRKMLVIGIALFISSLVKPNFALSFIPALGLFCLYYYRHRPKLLWSLAIVILPTALLLIFQSYLLLIENPLGKVRSVVFAPFVVWTRNNKIPWLSLLLATAFPLYVIILRYRNLRIATKLSIFNFMVACLTYALFRESGDDDFEWGFRYSLQLLFLSTIVEWLQWLRQTQTSSKLQLSPLCLGKILFDTHAAIGLVILYASFQITKVVNPYIT